MLVFFSISLSVACSTFQGSPLFPKITQRPLPSPPLLLRRTLSLWWRRWNIQKTAIRTILLIRIHTSSRQYRQQACLHTVKTSDRIFRMESKELKLFWELLKMILSGNITTLQVYNKERQKFPWNYKLNVFIEILCNIFPESISDVSVATLMVTLPSDDVRPPRDQNEGKVEMKNGAGRQDITETSPR